MDRRRIKLMIDVSIVEGCWSSVEDFITYVEYRLNLGKHENDSIKLDNIFVISDDDNKFNFLKPEVV